MANKKVIISKVASVEVYGADDNTDQFTMFVDHDDMRIGIKTDDQLLGIYVDESYVKNKRANIDDILYFSVYDVKRNDTTLVTVVHNDGINEVEKTWEIVTNDVEIEIDENDDPPTPYIPSLCNDPAPDPSLTPWPVKWTVEPASPNWGGTVGDSLYFKVAVVPDPDFPTWWNANMTDAITGITPPLPPRPTIGDVVVVEHTLFDNEYITHSSMNTVSNDTVEVYVKNANVFLPFESIKFEKDDEQYEVQYREEMDKIGYDFVYSFVPYRGAYKDVSITLMANSTWEHTLCGEFKFRVENNFDAVRDALQDIVSDANPESVTAEGDGQPTEFESSEKNESEITIPEFQDSYEEPDYDKLFSSDE